MKTVILGKLNRSDIVHYWNIESGLISTNEDIEKYILNKYAIVENKSDYDLVKIIGMAMIDENFEKNIMGSMISKSVVKILDIHNMEKNGCYIWP